MGGARCSYRSCTVRTDKKTHLFHYPVFDKLRCHQWITNAQKLNFLDLKLSQLKNRMICEHHFTDDSFMNDMKAKLKNNAVPTKDGPFCKPSTPNVSEYDDRQIPIILDDIENDYLTNLDKKAHFSVKYGDFLTNDIPEQTTMILVEDNGIIFNRNKNKNNFVYNHEKKLTSTNAIDTKAVDMAVDEKNVNWTSSLYNNKQLLDPKVMNVKLEELNYNTFKPDNKANETLSVSVLPSHKTVSSPIPQRKKVQIISEKRISEPVKIPKCELQHVSPSVVLRVPDKKKKSNVELNSVQINTYYVDVPNQQQIDNIQRVDNSGIISSQSTAAEQRYLFNEYNQPLTLSDTIESVNNSEVKNVDLLTQCSKQRDDNITSEDRAQLKQETEVLNDIVPNTMVPNVDFVSTTRPLLFTLTNQPQVSMHITDPASMQHNVSIASTEGQSNCVLSKDSEMHANILVNPDHTLSVSNNVQNVDKMLRNKQRNPKKKLPLTPSSVKANKSVLKSKLPPEKVAAIEEKRKFNMKLRDIINSCLNKLDEEPETSKLTDMMQKELSAKKVVEHLSSDSSLPTSQEYNISYLESRLQKMEDTLLNKIEQNSQRINDLKKTVVKPLSGKKSAYTQTYLNTETTKRHLYQQISQFLSPEANSLIYEELFLNKCVSKLELLPKKRKVK